MRFQPAVSVNKFQFSTAAIFLFGLTSQTSVIAATDFPQLPEPELQKLLDATRQEFEAFQKVGDAYFNLPSAKKDWACAVDANTLTELTGTANKKVREENTSKLDINFSEVVYFPVQSTCQNGKLNGSLEFWSEYVITNLTKDVTMTNKVRKRFVGQVSNNSWAGPVVSASKGLDQKTKYTDPQTEAMMADMKLPKTQAYFFSAEVPGKPRNQSEPSTTLGYILLDGVPSMTLDVMVPKPDSRKEFRHYGSFGPLSHLDYTKQYKGEKLHGPTVTYPGMMGQFPVAPSTVCYEDGEKILTTKCDVR